MDTKITDNFKELIGNNATYYWNPVRGGSAIIVGYHGTYLVAISSVNFDRHLEEYISGRRNGNFEK